MQETDSGQHKSSALTSKAPKLVKLVRKLQFARSPILPGHPQSKIPPNLPRKHPSPKIPLPPLNHLITTFTFQFYEIFSVSLIGATAAKIGTVPKTLKALKNARTPFNSTLQKLTPARPPVHKSAPQNLRLWTISIDFVIIPRGPLHNLEIFNIIGK